MHDEADPARTVPLGSVDPDMLDAGAPTVLSDWRRLVLVGLAGALGAVSRFGVGLLLPAPATAFPWATFLVNVSGCLAAGAALAVLQAHWPRHPLARPVVVTGFLGAYTTFSTYVVGVDLLVRSHEEALAAWYATGSLAAGTIATMTGLLFGRAICGLLRGDEVGRVE